MYVRTVRTSENPTRGLARGLTRGLFTIFLYSNKVFYPSLEHFQVYDSSVPSSQLLGCKNLIVKKN